MYDIWLAVLAVVCDIVEYPDALWNAASLLRRVSLWLNWPFPSPAGARKEDGA